jgi:hypothetical protein
MAPTTTMAPTMTPTMAPTMAPTTTMAPEVTTVSSTAPQVIGTTTTRGAATTTTGNMIPKEILAQMYQYGYKTPRTNIVQKDFQGSSNVFSPFIYYDQEAEKAKIYSYNNFQETFCDY